MSLINAEKQKTLTGAEIIIKVLKELGIECIFGYPGGIVLGIYDELYKQKDIKHYLVRHEQAAVHAAEGYARVSGKCGVVLVTSGPGASNTVSGIANAYLDGYPLIVLTGQVFSSLIGKNAFQEVNIIDITKSCTKAGFQVTDVRKLEKTLLEAYNCAMSGKPGPVVVDMAKNIFSETCEFSDYELPENKPVEISKEILTDILRELTSAQRPVIVSGGGVVGADKELKEFAKLLGVPVVNTMMGLGTYPADSNNYFGMVGIFGAPAANQILRESDLILSLGARFNDRITCCFHNGELERKFIQIDINPLEISRNVQAYKFIVADVKSVLSMMNYELRHANYTPKHSEWLSMACSLKNLNTSPKKISDKLHSFEVIRAIYEHSKDLNPVVTTEVGQHQIWTAQNFKFSTPRQFITSGGSGTMGFGLPAAIGACVAKPDKTVICISGDGSFQMNEQELAVCADYNLPIKIFILNNGYLGMVRQLQQQSFGGRYSETGISNPDFVQLARAYGIKALRVEKSGDVNSALIEALSVNEPFIVDFAVEPLEVV